MTHKYTCGDWANKHLVRNSVRSLQFVTVGELAVTSSHSP